MFDLIDHSDDNIVQEHEFFCMGQFLVSVGDLTQEEADKMHAEFKEHYG